MSPLLTLLLNYPLAFHEILKDNMRSQIMKTRAETVTLWSRSKHKDNEVSCNTFMKSTNCNSILRMSLWENVFLKTRGEDRFTQQADETGLYLYLYSK